MLISSEEDFEGSTKLGALLFLIPFWLAGLGMLISGLWMALATQELSLKPDGTLLSLRRFPGLNFRRKLETNSSTRVERVVAYEKNDVPVYTVQVSGKGKGRIRLSSTLSPTDLGWMHSQLRTALDPSYADPLSLSVENEETPAVEAELTVQAADLRETFSDHLTIRRTSSQSFEFVLGYHTSKALGVVGAFFVAVACFLAWDSAQSFLHSDESDLAFLDWPFIIIPAIMALVFGTIGLAVTGSAFALKGRKRTLQFQRESVIADPEWGLGTSGGTFRKDEFSKVDSTRIGHANGDPRFSVKLVGPEKAVTVCRFRNAEEAGLMAEWARGWLAGIEA